MVEEGRARATNLNLGVPTGGSPVRPSARFVEESDTI
jgi:hypothetical protein